MRKVLIFGSSFVNHLENFDTTVDKRHTIAGQETQFSYKGFRGKSFDLFLDNPSILDRVLQDRPDYVFVLLGSNSITTIVEESSILNKARDFYELLTEKLKIFNPEAIIIASQVPLRFVENSNNRHHTPAPAE